MNKLLIKITDNELDVKHLTKLYSEKKISEDSGFDLFVPTDISTGYNMLITINHGIACAMFCDNEPTGYMLVPRSSIIKTPYRMANSIGIIDKGYRGNIIAAVDSNITGVIRAYERLFQIVAPNFKPIQCEIVKKLPDSIRGKGGFGSTGK